MKILVTGASGLVGSRLIEHIDRAGDTCVALSRSPDRAAASFPKVARFYPWSTDTLPPLEAFAGVDAVVHLAGEPVVGRWTKAKRLAIRESRVRGTENLVKALEGLGWIELAGADPCLRDPAHHDRESRGLGGRGAALCDDWVVTRWARLRFAAVPIARCSTCLTSSAAAAESACAPATARTVAALHVVDFPNNARTPIVLELREFLGKGHFVHC